MEDDRARLLLSTERTRVQSLLHALREDGDEDRDGANQQGDMSDSAESLISEGTDEAVANSLVRRLEALDRAELRLDAGTYGRSVASGELIPDERLEANPAAELTVQEAEELR